MASEEQKIPTLHKRDFEVRLWRARSWRVELPTAPSAPLSGSGFAFSPDRPSGLLPSAWPPSAPSQTAGVSSLGQTLLRLFSPASGLPPRRRQSWRRRSSPLQCGFSLPPPDATDELGRRAHAAGRRSLQAEGRAHAGDYHATPGRRGTQPANGLHAVQTLVNEHEYFENGLPRRFRRNGAASPCGLAPAKIAPA
ncbi:hypothetical protein B0H12DRAFT_533724 [Mycena haematopus]|nr:hypothetical protein B0H12DRAFT_533724 [Mycena haematopus]